MAEEPRIVVRINRSLDMSPGKAAAQAVHAVLELLQVHPGCPVVVLEGTKTQVLAMEAHTVDAGLTEVEPGSVTAGASWDMKDYEKAYGKHIKE